MDIVVGQTLFEEKHNVNQSASRRLSGERKFCPFMTMQGADLQTSYCTAECALYISSKDRCSLRVIADQKKH